MEEENKDRQRIAIFLVGAIIFFFVFCFGCRQIALLEQHISERHRYNLLQQDLIELTETSEWDADDEFSDEEKSPT